MTPEVHHDNRDTRFQAKKAVAPDRADQSGEWLKEFPVLASSKAYRHALGDVILRTFFALTILAAGCWVPESYLDQIHYYWLNPDHVVRLAFFICKVAASVYGAMACWSFRCVFAAMWEVDRKSRLQNFPDLL